MKGERPMKSATTLAAVLIGSIAFAAARRKGGGAPWPPS